MACGTNLLTGQRITEEQPPAAKGKKWAFRMPTVSLKWVAIGTLGFLVVVILLFVLMIALNRDPVQAAIDAYEQGNAAEALTILNDYLESVPDSVEAHQALARMHWENANYLDAAKELSSVVRLDPTRRAGHLGLALSWAKSGSEDGRQRAIAALEEMVEVFPGDSDAWFLLGLLRGTQGDVEGQVEALREVALGEGARALAAQRLLAVGNAMQGYTEAARQAIQDVLQETPNNGNVLATAGTLISEDGDWITATEYLEAAVNSETAFEKEALTLLGILLVSQGEYGEASDYLMRALADDETNPRARLFHAVCLREQGLSEEAIQELDPLVKASGPIAAQAAIEMGRAYLAMDDPARASQSLQQAIQLGASGAALYTLQGRAYARAGEKVAAREAFRKAIQADTNYAPAHLEFGLYFLQEGAPSEAVSRFERYLELIDQTFEDTRADEVRTLVAQLKESLDAMEGAT